MKTLKKADEIKRVENKNADDMVKDGWTYIAKKEWKEKVRGEIKVKKDKKNKDAKEEVKEVKSKKYGSKNKDIDMF